MSLRILKFGGTSVADIQHIQNAAKIVLSQLEKGHLVIVVVSAMAGVTRSIMASYSIFKKQTAEQDAALSSGELLSSTLFALALNDLGVKAQSMQGWQIPITTDENYGNAYVKSINNKSLETLLQQGITPVIAGFQGISTSGKISTLGRGGSDTTAALIAASLKADKCFIYTDVAGVFSADPRLVAQNFKIDYLSPQEMYILSNGGAKVLHPRAALLAEKYNLKIEIRSTFASNLKGTTISVSTKKMENREIKAITADKNLMHITIMTPILNIALMLNSFCVHKINIMNYKCSLENELAKIDLLISLDDHQEASILLQNLQTDNNIISYSLNSSVATITILGHYIKHEAKILSDVINLSLKHNLQILSWQITENKLEMLINENELEAFVKTLHTNLIENNA